MGVILPINRFRKSALAAVGLLAMPNTCSAVTMTLTSSIGGVYDYGLTVSPFEYPTFLAGQSIVLSGLSGVTGASVSDTDAIWGFTASFTSTSAIFTASQPVTFSLGAGGTTGTFVVDSSVLTTGAANYSFDTSNIGTFTGTVSGPVAVTPLPPAWTMMLIGLAGFGVFAYRRNKASFA